MSDLRPQLEQLRDGLEPGPRSFERLVQRRRRKQRNERLLAGVVALALATGGTLLAVRAFTGTPAERRQGLGGDVRNGNIAFEVEGEGIYVVGPEGGRATKLVEGSDPAWSPGGEMLAFRTPLGSDSETHIAVVTADGTDVRHLTTREAGVTGAGPPTWSPDGETLAFADAHGLWTVSVNGSDLRQLTRSPGDVACYDLSPDWSPDGSRIVFALRCDGTDQGIFVVNADGSERTQLTGASGGFISDSDRYPVWSPDGTKIAFIRAGAHPEGREPNVYVMNADGNGVTQLTNEGLYETRPEWSPDGSRIAFADFHGRLFTMAPDGTDVQRIPDIEGCCPSWQHQMSPAESPGATEISPVDPRVTETVDVGAFPRPIAVGEGSVWVGVPAQGPGRDPILARIDPESNEVVGRIPIEESFESIAAGEGGVWVDSYRGTEPPYEPTLLMIDPLTERVEAEIPGVHGPLEIGAGSLWAFEGGPDTPWFLVRIDPNSNQVIARIAVPEPAWNVVAGEDALWVLTFEEQLLLKIDPSTNEVRLSIRIPSGGMSYAPVVTDGAVWVPRSTLQGITALRFDTETGESLGEPIPVRGSAGIGEFGGRSWFLAEDGAAYGVNTETLETDASVRFEWPAATATEPSAAIDPDTGTLWVANYRDTVTRVDLGS